MASTMWTYFYFFSLSCSGLLLLACDVPSNSSNKNIEQVTESSTIKLQDDFDKWLVQQDPKLIEKYKTFLDQHLENPPSLFALSYNTHIQKAECMQYRFALAPESQWKNIIAPLQLLESLQKKKIIKKYQIVSVYRGQEANICARGAKYSKHLQNYAVDFQVLDEYGKHYVQDDQTVQQQLCQYWKQQGQQLKLGLGTYTQHKFHIDVQGYRTWGHNYKRESSACL